MNPVIRPSRDEDVPIFAAIYAASVATETASWEYAAPSLAEFTRRRADVLAQGFPYYTAELDGAVVGYSHASNYRARIGFKFDRWLDSVQMQRALGEGDTTRPA